MDMLGPTLVKVEHHGYSDCGVKEPTTAALNGHSVIGLYFSADWCQPCSAFTLVLERLYTTLNSCRAKSLEVVLVSRCREAKSTGSYLKNMPWLSMWHDADDEMGMKAGTSALMAKYDITSIPALVLLDKCGCVICTNTWDKSVADLEGQAFPWRQQSQSSRAAEAKAQTMSRTANQGSVAHFDLPPWARPQQALCTKPQGFVQGKTVRGPIRSQVGIPMMSRAAKQGPVVQFDLPPRARPWQEPLCTKPQGCGTVGVPVRSQVGTPGGQAARNRVPFPAGRSDTDSQNGKQSSVSGNRVRSQVWTAGRQAATTTRSAALGWPVGLPVGNQFGPPIATGTAAPVPQPCIDTHGRAQAKPESRRESKRKAPPPDEVGRPPPPPKPNFGVFTSPKGQMSTLTEGKPTSLMQLQPLADVHPFTPTLKEWRHGINVDCGPDWTWDVIKAAVARGPHPMACTPKAIALFKDDIEYQRQAGFCKVIPWEELKRLRPVNLKISPVAAVPQVGRCPRIILDLSFLVYQEVNGVITATQASVNDTTALWAPKEAVRKIGKVLPCLLAYIRDTPAGLLGET
jgi:hypothetical protein